MNNLYRNEYKYNIKYNELHINLTLQSLFRSSYWRKQRRASWRHQSSHRYLWRHIQKNCRRGSFQRGRVLHLRRGRGTLHNQICVRWWRWKFQGKDWKGFWRGPGCHGNSDWWKHGYSRKFEWKAWVVEDDESSDDLRERRARLSSLKLTNFFHIIICCYFLSNSMI